MHFHFSPKIEKVIEPSAKKLVFITFVLQLMKIIVYSMYMLFFISFYFEYSIFLYFPGKEVKICYIFFQLLYAFLYRFGATCTWVEWWELGCACLICYFRVYTVLPLFSEWIVTAFIFTTICNGNLQRSMHLGRISGPLGMTICNMLFQSLYSITITFGVNCYSVHIYHYL